ncbi:MAG TPA: DUF177 domain-containing protein [Candidatus Merdisoma merdipullorum]|nr:DUF177 domain-containing protein [Candidatus Merdisoma merdipullorum]
MLINLTDVLSCDEKVVKRTVETELKSFDSDLGHFPLSEDEPLELVLTNLGNDKLLIEGSVKLTARIPCDRCLTEVETPMSLSFSREVDMKQSAEARIDDLDETNFIIGYNLDTEKLVYGELLVNWPMKTLCREDCRGICKKCGRNLNEGTCDCDTVELDPRMAVIAEIFKNSN